jgi:hypothetical protein
MDGDQHLKADYLRTEISKVKEWIGIAKNNTESALMAKISFIGREINLTNDYSHIVKDVAVLLKSSLEKELKRLQKEYSEL